MFHDALLRFRGTGRSTRMLDTAIARAKADGHVNVICASEQHGDALAHLLMSHHPDAVYSREARIVRVGNGLIHLCSVKDGSLDVNWREGYFRCRGSDPKIEHLVDHYTIEHEFGPLIHHWARYID